MLLFVSAVPSRLIAQDHQAHGPAHSMSNSIEGGYLRGLTRRGDLVIGVGGAATAALVGPLLAPRYGGRVAPGFAVFVNVRASSTDANAHH